MPPKKKAAPVFPAPAVGELVWAKFGSYPWWPAVRCDPREVGADDRPTPEALLVHFFSTLEYAWMKPALVQPFGHLREGRAKSKAPATLKVAVAQAEVYEKSGAVPEGWGRPYEAISKAKAKGGGKKASEAAARKRKAGGVADEAGELQLTKRERRVRVMRQLGLMAPEDSPYARGAAKAK